MVPIIIRFGYRHILIENALYSLIFCTSGIPGYEDLTTAPPIEPPLPAAASTDDGGSSSPYIIAGIVGALVILALLILLLLFLCKRKRKQEEPRDTVAYDNRTYGDVETEEPQVVGEYKQNDFL